MAVSAVFSVNQPEYDADYVYVPLPLARRLLQYTVQGSAVEVMPAPGVSDVDAARAIASAVGPRYDVLDRAGQQSGAFQIVNMEKWTGFMLLAFILIIASFNIISSMSLLIIEKEDNTRTLKALGASPGLIRRIYAVQGWLVSIAGGVAGMVLGVLLSLGQEMGMDQTRRRLIATLAHGLSCRIPSRRPYPCHDACGSCWRCHCRFCRQTRCINTVSSLH